MIRVSPLSTKIEASVKKIYIYIRVKTITKTDGKFLIPLYRKPSFSGCTLFSAILFMKSAEKYIHSKDERMEITQLEIILTLKSASSS